MPTVIDGTTGIVTSAIDLTTPLPVIDGGTALSSVGSAGNVLVSTGTAWSSANRIITGTAQNTTSGSSVEFTGIPSWVKQITIMLNGVSLSGSQDILIQLGSTTYTTSGYLSGSSTISTGVGTNSYTTGFGVAATSAGQVIYGSLTLSNFNNNIWGFNGNAYQTGTIRTVVCSGMVTIGGVLDRVRITNTLSDTFDGGSVNIIYS